MQDYSVIELQKDKFKFCAGHFTILSATERERLHGHNFMVAAEVTLPVDRQAGIYLDYAVISQAIECLCNRLDEYFLLPGKSPYLQLQAEGDYIYALFAQEKIPFLQKDVLVLDIANIALEDLSQWFVDEIVQQDFICGAKVQRVRIKVFTSPGQSASAQWERT